MITGAVVLYNTDSEMIKRIIKSFSPNKEKILFIIDNSKIRQDNLDGLSEYIEYIFTGKNIGYGAANNIGIRKSIAMKAKYHVIMNPDVYFEPQVIDNLKKYAEQHKDVVDIMPKVLGPDGNEQYLAKLLPTPFDVFSRRFLPQVGLIKKNDDRYSLRDIDRSKIFEAPVLSGCFMFLNVDILERYSLEFDERFFMYFEDYDFVRRLHVVGKTVFYPFEIIVHVHEKSSYKNIKMLIIHVASACKYFNKYGFLFDSDRTKYNNDINKY